MKRPVLIQLSDRELSALTNAADLAERNTWRTTAMVLRKLAARARRLPKTPEAT